VTATLCDPLNSYGNIMKTANLNYLIRCYPKKLSYHEDSDLLTNIVAKILIATMLDVGATCQYNTDCYQRYN